MQTKETHIVPPQEKAIRIQEYAVNIFTTIPTRSALKKAIKKGLILVNDQTSSTSILLNGGEKIELLEQDTATPKKQFTLSLSVAFEDDYLAIIEKPAGILVSGNTFKSIDNALVQNLAKSNLTDMVRPRPVHRLDYPTTGLLLIGKTSASILALNSLFEQRKVHKTYHAITIGSMTQIGRIQSLTDGKEAVSHFKVLQSVTSNRFEELNLVELSPETGRKHQLRKHMSELNNPILGDTAYGKEGLILKRKGLYLHASKLEFTHPFTEEYVVVESKLPKKFIKIFPDFAF
ncbi:RluA family pseudouridine synthase [Flavobacteriaceae bacterium S356]|uniref:RluA family pseudouridine synthase n=1 Tax=Asprobacillus argus TaxID=3076534 RepID=A0ABU3LHZ1_9FLAO|nr:RluA family pseudouridine synthase [Flavobacteriaceae bacterium S356]